MADMKDPRGKEPAPRKREPVFSHSPDADTAEGGASAPAVLRRPAKAAKKKSWFEQNRTLVIGIAAGAGVLAVVLVLGIAFGLFSSGNGPRPSVAPSPTPVAAQPAAPQAPAAPAQPPSQSTSSQPKPTQAAPSQTAQTPAAQGGGFGYSPTQPVPTGQSPPPGQSPPQNAKKDEPKKQQKPPVPDDVAKWKPADYKLARHDNHPNLLEAIVRLGEKYPGSEKAAQCLVDLLKPLPPEKPSATATASTPAPQPMPVAPQPRGRGGRPPLSFGGGTPGTSSQNPAVNPTPTVVGPRPYTPADLTKLVETIVEALGCNGSSLARNTFEQVLAGTFATDDDKTAIEATLKTLLAHPSDQGDTLLLRAITVAKDLRSADHQGPLSAKDLEAKAFELIKQSASIGLRTKLAEIALGKHAKLDPKDPDTEFLMLPNPLNCGAQLLIYRKADTRRNRELRTTLEQQFVGYSSTAMAGYLAIPAENVSTTPGVAFAPPRPMGGFNGPPGQRGGRGGFGGGEPPVAAPIARPGETAKAADANLGSELAAQFWGDDFRKLIEPQVADLRSLDKQPQLMLLAATIPLDSTRAVLYKLLHKRWNDGPKALETAGLIDRAITDPGLLPIIKMSGPRKESPSTPRVTDAAAARRGGRTPPPAPGGARNEASQKKQQAEQDWMDVSAKLASAWCKRFSSVSDKDTEAADKPAGEFKLPSGIEMPSAARIVASHHVVLPGPAPTSLSQVQPSMLDLYYVRVEESAKPKKATQFYCRLAMARKDQTRTFESKTWIDCGKLTPQKDRYRSIDVLITHPQGAASPAVPERGKGRAPEEDEVDLTVEVLIIEIKDPSKEPAKDAAKEPAKDSEKKSEDE
jgi:hypothetical protein